jgi:hypothetical protein
MTEPLAPFAEAGDLAPNTDQQLAWASERIRAYCGWHIYPSIEQTATFDTLGGSVLMLPTLRLTAVTAVALADGTDLNVDDDLTWSEAGMLRRATCWAWPSGFRQVAVTFEHGYEALPGGLAEVCAAAATRAPAQLASVTAESVGGVSRTYGGLLSGAGALSAGWTFAEQQVLDRYRLPSLP